MALSDTAIRAAKAKGKPYKLFDSGGLFLIVSPSGGKLWRVKYRFNGKEMGLALETYPATGLKEARKRRDDARALLEKRIDPSIDKKKKAMLRQFRRTIHLEPLPLSTSKKS